jgi:DNA repair protein RadC
MQIPDGGNVHKGHRERLKQRFKDFGADALAEHELLELLLFYAIPRGDVNTLAHALLARFGTLYKVFNAPAEALTAIDGVGENTALLIKLLPQLWRRYDLSRNEYVLAPKAASDTGLVFTPYFFGLETEVVYIMTLTARGQMIRCSKVFEGTVSETDIYTRRIIELALSESASGIIIAHNHPNGDALPSREDIAATKRLISALALIDVKIIDHVIVSGNDWVSLKKTGAI